VLHFDVCVDAVDAVVFFWVFSYSRVFGCVHLQFLSYPTVRQALNMLGSFEDIVDVGANIPAAVAILYSETSDIWLTTAGTYGSALRTMLVNHTAPGFSCPFGW
jgi:hypothetical protein